MYVQVIALYIYMTVLLCGWCTCNICTVHCICDVLYKQCIYCQTQCTRYQFYVTRSTSSFYFSNHKIFDRIFSWWLHFLLLILNSIVTGSVHRTQCLALTHHLMFPSSFEVILCAQCSLHHLRSFCVQCSLHHLRSFCVHSVPFII